MKEEGGGCGASTIFYVPSSAFCVLSSIIDLLSRTLSCSASHRMFDQPWSGLFRSAMWLSARLGGLVHFEGPCGFDDVFSCSGRFRATLCSRAQCCDGAYVYDKPADGSAGTLEMAARARLVPLGRSEWPPVHARARSALLGRPKWPLDTVIHTYIHTYIDR